MRIAAVGAVVTAVVTAILSPSTFGAIKDWFVDDPKTGTTTAPPSSPSPRPVTLKEVSTDDGALSLDIPEDWGYADSHWDLPIGGLLDDGTGVRAGIGAGLTTTSSYDIPGMYLGASTNAAERLELSEHPDELESYIMTLARSMDGYASDGCVPDSEGSIDKPGVIGRYRVWTGCRGFTDTRLWDAYYVTADGEVLLTANVVGTRDTTEEQELSLLTDWTLRPDLVPDAEKAEPSDVDTWPRPPWSDEQGSGDRVIP